MDPSSFFPIISGMLGGVASAGLFKGPIKTVEDWWYVNFGYKANEQAEMLRVKQSINIENYKKSLLEKISKIPSQNLKEPDFKILGPTLEASKYYIEEQIIRNMFAELIASSMNSIKSNFVRSSFVEIIKQMEPLDAQNLKLIFNNNGLANTAIIKSNVSVGGYQILFVNLFLLNQHEKNQERLSSSLDNLERLGLVKISYAEHNSDISSYEIFKNTTEFKDSQIIVDDLNKANETKNIQIDNSVIKKVLFSDPELKHGVVRLTYLGYDFCATCL